MIGDADQAFRGFNRRDRVLANDNTFQDVLTAAGPAAISAAGVVAIGVADVVAKVRSARRGEFAYLLRAKEALLR